MKVMPPPKKDTEEKRGCPPFKINGQSIGLISDQLKQLPGERCQFLFIAVGDCLNLKVKFHQSVK